MDSIDVSNSSQNAFLIWRNDFKNRGCGRKFELPPFLLKSNPWLAQCVRSLSAQSMLSTLYLLFFLKSPALSI